jgi:thiol-disulfide isomerase/thioredoxin
MNGSPFLPAGPQNTAKSGKKAQTIIRGKVVDLQGKGVPGVSVVCFNVANEDWPREQCRIHTDTRGLYQFTVPAMGSYEINAGGSMSTPASSEKFNIGPNETYQVEKLIVRPAANSCKGRLLFEDGRPAANLPYGCLSRSFCPGDDLNPSKTNNKGEFVIEHILPDEPFSFWVIPKEDTLWVWKRLDPNSKNLELTLKTSEYIELPADCLSAGLTHLAIARDMTFAKDSRIRFSLPDLDGNKISLEDEQFKDKAVVVNICGSWCGGCRAEIPYLVEAKNKYQDKGLQVVGIAFERGSKEEQFEAVRKMSRDFKVNYPMLVGGFADKKNVADVIDGLELFLGYPTTLYIDKGGLVRHIQSGFYTNTEAHKIWQLKKMEDHIKMLLAD